MKHLLFICGKNRLRSPTAEEVFSNIPGIETASAGVDRDADEPLTAELVQWADTIFLMERSHRRKLQQKFAPWLNGQSVICLNIPDNYDYMEPALVDLLQQKVKPFLHNY